MSLHHHVIPRRHSIHTTERMLNGLGENNCLGRESYGIEGRTLAPTLEGESEMGYHYRMHSPLPTLVGLWQTQYGVGGVFPK